MIEEDEEDEETEDYGHVDEEDAEQVLEEEADNADETPFNVDNCEIEDNCSRSDNRNSRPVMPVLANISSNDVLPASKVIDNASFHPLSSLINIIRAGEFSK